MDLPCMDMGELYGQNIDWLVRFIYKKVNNPNEAQDLAQDVFERLLKKNQKLLSDEVLYHGNVRAFISTIAKGIIIDSWRKKEIERKYLEYLTDQQQYELLEQSDFTVIIDAISVLDQMLRKLDDKVRLTFLLSQLYGKTYVEIAKQLEISERTVKTYMAKAMFHCMKIRAELEQ